MMQLVTMEPEIQLIRIFPLLTVQYFLHTLLIPCWEILLLFNTAHTGLKYTHMQDL